MKDLDVNEVPDSSSGLACRSSLPPLLKHFLGADYVSGVWSQLLKKFMG